MTPEQRNAYRAEARRAIFGRETPNNPLLRERQRRQIAEFNLAWDAAYDLGLRVASQLVMNAGRPTMTGEWSTGELSEQIMEKVTTR